MPMSAETIAKLKELKELLDAEVLTKEEFDEQKKMILAGPKEESKPVVMGKPMAEAEMVPVAEPTAMQPVANIQGLHAGGVITINQRIPAEWLTKFLV